MKIKNTPQSVTMDYFYQRPRDQNFGMQEPVNSKPEYIQNKEETTNSH